MKMDKFLAAVSLLLITIAAQNNPDKKYVAKVGDEVITQNQFKTRYEFTPQIGSHIGESKNSFLYTLIAEKLWAQQARAAGLHNEPVIAATLNAIKKMFIRDQLYKNEISSKVSIDESEIAQAVERELSTLTLAYLRADSQQEINNLYYLLSSGYSFDSLLVSRPEVNDKQNNSSLSYSEINPVIADSVYKLNVGEFTKPVETDAGWFIFFLKERNTSLFPNSEGKAAAVKKAEDRLREIKEAELYEKFMKSMFIKREVKVDAKLFQFIVDKFSAILKSKEAVYDTLFIDSNDAYFLVKSISQDTLSLPFIMLDNSPVTLSDFICEFSFYGFETNSYEKSVFAQKLNAKIREFIEYEVLAREGIKRGYDVMPEVEESVKMWSDYYLSYFYKNSLKDSVNVTESEIDNFISETKNKQNQAIEYNAIELLTDSLQLIKDILSITDGNNLRRFVLKHTKRNSVRENNGELGWFTSLDYPEFSKVAEQLDVGDTYGPIKLENGYSFLKLIGKRNTKEFFNLKNNRRQAEALLKEKKYSDLLLKKTIEFANNNGFEINSRLLEEIDVTGINAYLIRMMGFGGTLPAVPLSTPFYDWVEYYYNQDKISL